MARDTILIIMAKVIGWTVIIFFVLVTANYLFISFESFLTYGGFAQADQSPSDGRLGAVNFTLFDKDGIGWSYVTQGYGRTPYSYVYPNDWHDGIDIAAAYGAPIYSPATGTIMAVGDQDAYCYHRGFGRYVALRDDTNGLVLWFAHLGNIAVRAGDTIKNGALVGNVGTTGFETGTHLHFSVFKEDNFTMTPRNGCGPEPTGRDLDPLKYLGTTYK